MRGRDEPALAGFTSRALAIGCGFDRAALAACASLMALRQILSSSAAAPGDPDQLRAGVRRSRPIDEMDKLKDKRPTATR